MKPLIELLPFIDVMGKEAVCRVELIPLEDGRCAVICEELDENPGQSVSGSWEAVVIKVCRTYGLTPQAVVWIEHNQEQIKVGGGSSAVTSWSRPNSPPPANPLAIRIGGT